MGDPRDGAHGKSGPGKAIQTVIPPIGRCHGYNGFIQACVNGANPVTLVTNFLKNHAKFAGAVEVE